MDNKYIQDAELLIKDATSKKIKNVVAKTKLPTQVTTSHILPSYVNLVVDGFKNLISGLGGSNAKNTHTTYRNNFCISDQLLYNLYESHGLSRKICEVIPKDATKNDIEIKGDNEGILFKKWKKLKAIEHVFQADSYRRFFGGSLIYMDIDDGKELFEPVNLNNIKSVRKLRTYARTDVFFTNANFIEDINSEIYGQPEYYTIIPKYTTPFNIHYSRVLEFKGLEVPSHLDNGYRYYWGQSIIELLWESLKKVGASLENLDQLLYEMTIAIYRIKGLADLICSKDWTTIKEIIDHTELSKSTIRAILLDAEGHDYKRDSLNFAGVKEVIEIMMTMLSAESYIPISRLFGKQLGGLNNEGTHEMKMYNDEVKEHQRNKITSQSQQLIDLINISKEIGNKKIKEPEACFNSPYQLTQKEELENKKIQMEIDNNYINTSVMSNEEVRELRCEGNYTFDMDVTELDSFQEIVGEEEIEEPEENNSPEE